MNTRGCTSVASLRISAEFCDSVPNVQQHPLLALALQHLCPRVYVTLCASSYHSRGSYKAIFPWRSEPSAFAHSRRDTKSQSDTKFWSLASRQTLQNTLRTHCENGVSDTHTHVVFFCSAVVGWHRFCYNRSGSFIFLPVQSHGGQRSLV